jgi:signal transduction histidine kinase
VIATIKRHIARYWPRLRLRTIIFGTLLLVAALPGFSAIFLRVYENALIRRTEAELVAQGAAVAASAALLWPRDGLPERPAPPTPTAPGWSVSARYEVRPTEVDLSTAPILPERPRAQITTDRADPAEQAVADRLAPVIRETQLATLAAIRLTDWNGILLNGGARGQTIAGLPELQAALAGGNATVMRRSDIYHPSFLRSFISRASGVRLHHARPINVNGRVVGAVLISRTPPPLLSGMVEDAGKIAFGVVAIFVLLLLITGVLARAIIRPIEALSRATRGVAAGRAAIPGDPSLKVVEIEALYGDFRAMADGIAARSKYLRDFAASLSHEFKTPLSGITGGIELLEDHGPEMSAEERARFLTNMRGDAGRLTRLLGRLMELAKADMRVGDVGGRCAPAAIIASVASGLERPGFAVVVDMPDELSVAMDGETLQTIATILIENAAQAGAGQLTVCAEPAGDQVMLSFADNGPGVPTGDRTRIFDTFFTSKRESGGTGLGLAIARSLAEAEGGSLLLSEGGAGALFCLTVSA